MDRIFVVSILMILLTASYPGAQKDKDHIYEQGTPGQKTGREMQKYNYESNQKFLNDIEELRRELHKKRFEYYEALRNPDIGPEKVAAIESEVWDLQRKIFDTWQKQFY